MVLRLPALPSKDSGFRWASRALPFVLAAGMLGACGDGGGGTTGAPPTTTTSSVKSSTPTTTGSTAASAPTASSTASAAPSTSASTSASAVPSASAPTNLITPLSAGSASGEVKGEQKGGPSYSAYMGGQKVYKAGQPGAVSVVVSALNEYHVNPTYKYKMKMDAPPAGVTYAADTVLNASKSEKQASMSVAFTPSAPGSYTLTGTCSLSVCNEGTCVVDKVPLSVTVKVE